MITVLKMCLPQWESLDANKLCKRRKVKLIYVKKYFQFNCIGKLNPTVNRSSYRAH